MNCSASIRSTKKGPGRVLKHGMSFMSTGAGRVMYKAGDLEVVHEAVPDQRQGDQHPELAPSSPTPSLTPKQTTTADEQTHARPDPSTSRYTDDTLLLSTKSIDCSRTLPTKHAQIPRPPDSSTTVSQTGSYLQLSASEPNYTPKPNPFITTFAAMEEERLWKFSKPEWLNSAWARNFGVYGAGALFSIAFYVMLDSAVWSKSARNGSDTHVTFVDWLPLIFSSLGMLIINSVEKARLSADSFSYSGNGVAWKARVVLFLGFAALAGGMAGGVTVFVLKFVVQDVAMPALGMGIENVVANALVGLSSVVLWISQNMEDEYSYNLAL
ncbi:hypothetical protein Landi51_02329 [Colletotrichum acutatum]